MLFIYLFIYLPPTWQLQFKCSGSSAVPIMCWQDLVYDVEKRVFQDCPINSAVSQLTSEQLSTTLLFKDSLYLALMGR